MTSRQPRAAFPGMAILAFLLSGCGYIGEPLPPLLNIPARVADLAAVQRGPNIVVHFTVPALTTEGALLRQAATIDVRTGLRPTGTFDASAWAGSAKPAGQGVIENGRATYRIPATDWIGKEVAIAVKVIGANGRDAGWSNPVVLTVVPPPEQPFDLRAEDAPHAVRLVWGGNGTDFGIFRQGPDDPARTLVGHSDRPEWTDTTIQYGKTYRYAVQSFAKAGQGQAESEASNEVRITPADVFPPAVPAGLRAVPSASSIELAWERVSDSDLAGYRVYRALAGGPLQRIAETPETPSYSDHKIEPGKVYRYAVSAVKRNGLESRLSGTVEVSGP